ncbi:unnamed protein product [Rotaria sp. Silwood1]|nr:unnamed protein product [Rotaria sp. Silwood1]CAF1631506.1 unnamed protein product [Rotaria sp. Silwood1]
MQKLINHVRNCNEFTFDTEGEKSTKQLTLIQIQTIPQQLPFFCYISRTCTFTTKNNIYSWKPLRKEMYPAIVFQWFEWPIKTSVVNFQLKFC